METFQFKLDFTVRDYECDFQGIVGHTAYLNYLQHTRHEFLKKAGMNPVEMAKNEINLVTIRLEIDYKNSLQAGDSFFVGVNAERISRLKFAFYEKIFKSSNEQLILEAKATGIALNNQGKPFFPKEAENLLLVGKPVLAQK